MAVPGSVQRPASYFQSIAMAYGYPKEHLFTMVCQRQGQKPVDMVNWLKSEHSMARAKP